MNIKVKTNDGADLGELVSFLKTIEECCRQGASRDLHLSVDGDGSANMSFEFEIEGADKVTPKDVNGDLKFSIGE